jgi:hypothetical protein
MCDLMTAFHLTSFFFFFCLGGARETQALIAEPMPHEEDTPSSSVLRNYFTTPSWPAYATLQGTVERYSAPPACGVSQWRRRPGRGAAL